MVIFSSSYANANDNSTIKVALVDQLMSQKLSSIDYANDYMKGIKTAIIAADKNFHIQVALKRFSYRKGYLGPITIIDKVNSWNPDFIIGPRSSTKFLLLEPFFKKILVVSPIATANRVYNMPKNFYSMSLPDSYMAKSMVTFALKNFPKSKGTIILDAADCISCHNVAHHIFQYYKSHAYKKKVISRSFIGNNVETINIKQLVKGWKPGYLICSPNISYVSGVLVSRVTDFLDREGLVFLGGDEWGKHEVGFIGQLKTKYPFVAYHLQDWSLNHGGKDLEVFNKTYTKVFKVKATDPISYASFHGLYSVLSVLNAKTLLSKSNKREYILRQFQSYISKHNNAFRQVYYVFYKWNHQSNKDVVVAVMKARSL